MKAIHQFFAGIALAIPLLGVGVGVGVAWGDSSVVGGNVIVDRPPWWIRPVTFIWWTPITPSMRMED